MQRQQRRQQRQQRQQQRRGRSLPGAVGALCRALPPHARPAPDTFRCAKFDRPQASLDFWRLLYALLKQVHGRKWTESDGIDNQIRFVKAALWYHGYDRPELYRLPSDGSAGSRELLLAFSWLLHRISLLEQLLARNRVKTGDETSVCTCEDDLPNSLKGTTEKAPKPGLEGGVDVRYLQWLNGRLRFQWRSLHAQHQEQCKLLHKVVYLNCGTALFTADHELEFLPSSGDASTDFILWLTEALKYHILYLGLSEKNTSHFEDQEIHLFTSGSHMDQVLGHLSVTETDLVRQPENYKQLLQLLESETLQLEAFLEWKQLEPVYWQWMETVLDNMAEEGNVCESQDAHVEGSELPKVTSCCPWADSLTGQIDRLSRDLTTLRDQLHKLVTRRKAEWCEKVKTREKELQKEGFSAAARKIQESVELKLLDLTYLCAPPKKRMHGSHRLVFRSKHPASKMVFGRSVSKESFSTVSATEVIRELQMREASLVRELKQLQEECRQRLNEVAEGLDGVICISP